MKSKRLKHNKMKTRKKKNRRTRKIKGQSKLETSNKEYEQSKENPDQSLVEALSEIDKEIQPTDALEPTDHPMVLLPTPIPVEYDVFLEDLLNKLEVKGETHANPSYKALGPYVKFIYDYFIRKYKSPLLLVNNQPYKHRAVLNYLSVRIEYNV